MAFRFRDRFEEEDLARQQRRRELDRRSRVVKRVKPRKEDVRAFTQQKLDALIDDVRQEGVDGELRMTAEHVLAQLQLEDKLEQLLLQSGVRKEVLDQLPQVRRLTTGVPAPLISQQSLKSIRGNVVPNALEKRVLTRDAVVPGTDASYVTYIEDPNAPGSPLVANLVDEVITDDWTRRQLFGLTTSGGVKPGNEHVAEVALKSATGQPVHFEPNGVGRVDFEANIDGRRQFVDAQVRPMNAANEGALNMQLVSDAYIPEYQGSSLKEHKDEIQRFFDDYVISNQKANVDPSVKTVLDAAVHNGVLQPEYGIYEDNTRDRYGNTIYGRQFAGKALRPKYDQVLYSTVPQHVAKLNTKYDGFPLAQAVDALHLLDHGGAVMREPIGSKQLKVKQNTGGGGNKKYISSKIELQVPESRAVNVMSEPRFAGATQLLRNLPYA